MLIKLCKKKYGKCSFKQYNCQLKEREHTTKTMQSKIQKLYSDFINLHKSQFENPNKDNKNTLMQIANQTKETVSILIWPPFKNYVKLFGEFGVL